MSFNAVFENIDMFVAGAFMSAKLAICAWLVAIALALVLVSFRIAPQAPLRILGTSVIEFLRNVPPIVIVFFVYFGLPQTGIAMSGFASVVLGVALYSSALMAETIRSGVFSVQRGQYETAIATGMSYVQAMRYVVLPQALRIVVPPLGTDTINLVKNTSLGAAVSVGEIVGVANLVGSRTFAYAAVFTAAGVVYMCLTWPIAAVVNAIEAGLSRK